MDCKEAHGVIQESLDGEASPERSAELREHLEQCAPCRQYYEDSRLLVDTLSGLGLVEPGPEFAEDIMETVGRVRYDAAPQDTRGDIGRAPSWLVALMAWAKGAAVMAAVILAFGMLNLFVPQDVSSARVLCTDPSAQVQIAGRSVSVPEGTTLHGNLTVLDGNLTIFGKVEGDVRVIRGSVKKAPGADVGGRVVIIDSPLAQAKDAVLGAIDWFLSFYQRAVYMMVGR